MTSAQYIERIVLFLDGSNKEHVRIGLLAPDNVALASFKVDLAALRQAVLHLDEDPEATHVLKRERAEPWQALGEVATHIIEKVVGHNPRR